MVFELRVKYNDLMQIDKEVRVTSQTFAAKYTNAAIISQSNQTGYPLLTKTGMQTQRLGVDDKQPAARLLCLTSDILLTPITQSQFNIST